MVATLLGVVTVSNLASVIDTYAAADILGLPTAVLAEQITDLDRAAARIAAEKARRVAAFDAAGGADTAGYQTTAAWLRGTLHCGQRDATTTVRTARQLRDLPQLAGALAAGDVTWDHVTCLAPATTECRVRHGNDTATGIETILTTLARTETVDACRLAARRVRTCLDPAGTLDTADRAFERRYLSVGQDDDGCVHLRGLLDPEGGAVFLSALDAATPPPTPGDDRTPAQRRGDALVDLSLAAAGNGQLPTVGGRRPHATLVTDLTTLQSVSTRAGVAVPPVLLGGLASSTGRSHGQRAADPPKAGQRAADPAAAGTDEISTADTVAAAIRALLLGAARIDWTGPVPAETAQRITCDSEVTRIVLDGDGHPVNLGRTRRLVTPAQRIALAARDGGCIGCGRPAQWTDAHHLVHWADGGNTDLDDMVLLCRYDHRKVHEKGWTIVTDDLGRHRLAPPSRRARNSPHAVPPRAPMPDHPPPQRK